MLIRHLLLLPSLAALALALGLLSAATAGDLDQARALRTAFQPDAALVAIESIEDESLQELRAQLMLESELLGRLGDEAARATMPADIQIARLLAQPLTAIDLVTLGRLCLVTQRVESGLDALGRARDLDPSVKSTTDDLIAAHRGEPVPTGGYLRYFGEWLPMERQQREHALDQALLAVAAALGDASPLGFRPRDDARNRETFERTHGRDGGALLRSACATIRAGLVGRYEAVAAWLPSYRNPSLRDGLIEDWRALDAPRDELLKLIERYEKPDQPEVDGKRRALEKRYDSYRAGADRELRGLFGQSADDAYGLLVAIRAGEDALAAADRYLRAYDAPGLTPPPIDIPPRADVSGRHVLPGRSLSPLPDVLWVVLHAGAEHDIEVLLRADEMLRQEVRLRPWERWLLRELRDRAVLRYNQRVTTSADSGERDFCEVVNRYRRVLGLAPFELEERLVVCARKHSQEMIDLRYFGHISPVARNRTPSDRARLEGFGTGVGENCLAGGPGISGQGAFDGWYHSPGHHRLMVGGAAQMGIGAAGDHAMWTMVAGGDDASWRLLHRDRPPHERRAAEPVATNVAQSITMDTVAAARAMTRNRLDELFAPLARLGFEMARDRDGRRQERAPALLSIVVDAAVSPSFRPLQVAAVAACIDMLVDGATKDARRGAWRVVKPLLHDASLTFDDNGKPQARRDAALAIRRHWEDVAQLSFRPDGLADEPAAHRVVESLPPLKAPLKVLTKAERGKLAAQLGGSRETEKAVDNGLRWLASIQADDGSFRARSFPSQLKRIRGFEDKLGQGRQEYEVAMTGLAVLAFVAAGSTTQVGEYAATVDRAVRFLMSRISDYGMFECGREHYMYRHAIATQALCEAYAYSADPLIGVHAQLAIDYLVYAQDRDTGGWRYRAHERGDTSVTGWVAMALNAAHKAELRVSGFRDAIRFLNSVTYPQYFQIGYTDRTNGGTDRLGAVGTLCRIFMTGDTTSSAISINAWRLMKNLPAPGREDFYYWYYATLVLFQVGSDFWSGWNDALVKALLAAQDDDRRSPLYGSWPPQGEHAPHGGRVYQTALGVLMLTTYYRYDRNRRPLTSVFTGDLEAELRPYLDVLVESGDDVAVAVASRAVVDRFGIALMAKLVAELRRDDIDERYRRRLCDLLPSCAGPDHEAAIVELLAATDDGEASAILVRALDAICTRRSVPVLIDCLQHDNREVRAYAASALGRIGDSAAMTPLRERLASEGDGWCKAQINEAMQRFTHRTSVTTLLDDALGKDAPGRLTTLAALELLEGHRVGECLLRLKESEPGLYASVLADLRERREGAVIPVLLRGMESQDEETRTRSSQLLRVLAQRDEGYQPNADEGQRAQALERLRRWWQAQLDEATRSR